MYPTAAPSSRRDILGQNMREQKLLALKYPNNGNIRGHHVPGKNDFKKRIGIIIFLSLSAFTHIVCSYIGEHSQGRRGKAACSTPRWWPLGFGVVGVLGTDSEVHENSKCTLLAYFLVKAIHYGVQQWIKMMYAIY